MCKKQDNEYSTNAITKIVLERTFSFNNMLRNRFRKLVYDYQRGNSHIVRPKHWKLSIRKQVSSTI